MTILFFIAVAGMALMAYVGYYIGKTSQERRISEIKDAYGRQLDVLKEMNRKQVEDQLAMIRQQMVATSEEVLKKDKMSWGKETVNRYRRLLTRCRKV